MIFTIFTGSRESLTIAECAQLIEDRMCTFDAFFKRDEWYLPRKQKILLSEKSSLSSALVKQILSDKKPYYENLELDENTVDEFESRGTVYSSVKYDSGFKINFTVGGTDNYIYIYFKNWESFERFSERDYVLGFMHFVACNMEVKYMEIFDPAFCYKTLDVHPGKDFPMGWMFYVDGKYDVSVIPKEYEVLPIGKGHVVIVTNEIFDINNEEHQKRAKTLLSELRSNNFFKKG